MILSLQDTGHKHQNATASQAGNSLATRLQAKDLVPRVAALRNNPVPWKQRIVLHSVGKLENAIRPGSLFVAEGCYSVILRVRHWLSTSGCQSPL